MIENVLFASQINLVRYWTLFGIDKREYRYGVVHINFSPCTSLRHNDRNACDLEGGMLP